MQEDTSLDEETVTNEHPRDDKNANYAETMEDEAAVSTQEQNVTESVRHRRNRHICEVHVYDDSFTRCWLSSRNLVLSNCWIIRTDHTVEGRY